MNRIGCRAAYVALLAAVCVGWRQAAKGGGAA
jgi:hypothetical protein